MLPVVLRALHIPGGIAIKIAVVLVDKSFYYRSSVPQAEGRTVAGVAYGIIGPREHNRTERVKGTLEIIRRPGFAGAAIEDRIAHNDAVVAFDSKRQHIEAVAGRGNGAQGVVSHLHGVTIIEPAVSLDRYARRMRSGVGQQWHLQALLHLI
jgi:hypothetical protein